MNSIQHLIEYNSLHLRQGLGLIEHLEEEQYRYTQPPVYGSSIGEHIRHILEHYSCFLEGVPGKRIDYDARRREESISSNQHVATSQIKSHIDHLASLNQMDEAVQVKMSSWESTDETSPWSESTVKRELQYLLAHTIHHFALIAMIVRLQGVEPDPSFGVAPSTLRHRRQMEVSNQAN